MKATLTATCLNEMKQNNQIRTKPIPSSRSIPEPQLLEPLMRIFAQDAQDVWFSLAVHRSWFSFL